jgi:hypothetical protein
MRLSCRLLCLLFLLSLTVHAEPAGRAANAAVPPEFSPDAILRFTRFLIEKEEYYRAFTELQRLHSFHPGYIGEESRYATELYLLYQGKQYNEVLARRPPAAGERVQCIDAVFKADAYLTGPDLEPAGKALEPYREFGPDMELRSMVSRRLFLTSLMLGQLDRARSLLGAWDEPGPGGPSMERYRELLAYAGKKHALFKRPATAALLGIAPGMGYVYAGNGSTGFIALAVVSALSGLTYLAWTTDNKPLAIFFCLGATFFYGGSIIGGYREAVGFNRWLGDRMKEDLSEGLNLEKDRQRLYDRFGIAHGGAGR